jgi:hypothetical protein
MFLVKIRLEEISFFRNEEKTSGGSNYKHLVPPGLTACQFLSLIDTRPESGRITLPENVQDWHYMVRSGSRLVFVLNPDPRVFAAIRGNISRNGQQQPPV